MDELAGGDPSEIVETLKYLIPGLISVLIFRSFTARPHNSTFESVVLALIFTFASGLLAAFVSPILFWLGGYFSLGILGEDEKTALSAVIAALLGVASAMLANRDAVHRIARAMRLTNETSYPTQWYSSFRNRPQFVVLHLRDGRSIYGWPTEWPSQPDSGHFMISQVTWIDEASQTTDVPNSAFLVSAADVEMVEFVSGEADA